MLRRAGDGRPPPLGGLLLRAFAWFDASLLPSLAAEGWPQLTRSQALVFAHLDRKGTRTAELARRIGVTRQAAHQTVKELVHHGLVMLEPDPTNRSAKLVVRTEKGRDVVGAALEAFAEIEVRLAQRIGAEHVARLRHALEKEWGEPIVVGDSAASEIPLA